jgi:outer membrane protein assembly factor BamB
MRAARRRRAIVMPRLTRRTAWWLHLAGCALVLPFPACRRSGGAQSVGGAPTPRIRWAVDTGAWGSPAMGPAVGLDGTVFTMGSVVEKQDERGKPLPYPRRRARLHAVDAGGAILRTMDGSLIDSPYFKVWIRIAPWGSAYAVDSGGGLYGLFPDGTQQFRSAGGGLAGPPAIDDGGRLFVGSPKGLLGFDLQALEWTGPAVSFGVGHNANGPVRTADGALYWSTSYGGRLYAVDAAGEERVVGRASTFTTLVADESGQLYFSDRNRLVALDPAGQPRWEYVADDELSAPVLSPDGAAIVIGAAGLVQAVGSQGQRRWSFPLETASWSRPAVGADGAVYACDRTGRLSAIAPGGRRRWAGKMKATCGTPAAAADGTVYVECTDGKLYAVTPP